MGYNDLQRALQSENNHNRHIEGPFQTEVLKTGQFKALRNERFWTVQLMDTLAIWLPMIICAASFHDNSISIWARDDDAEGHFKKQLFGPLPTPFNPS